MSILPIFIPHAGCPHQCVFCNQKRISGQSSATVANAKAQIDRWLQWLKPSREHEAAFYGGSFTGLEPQLQESLLELTDGLLEHGIIGRVRCSTRPDYITPEALQRLLDHRLTTVELGVQSLDDKVLEAAERGHTAAQVETAMQLLKEYCFTTGIQLMVGMPQQDFASVKETVAKVVALKPDIARIYPLLVIKDTPLAKAYEQGLFKPLSIEDAVEQAAYVYEQLTNANINVIRIGLQADEELTSPGNILAGPFHPSMGELVKSRVLRNEITPKVQALYQKGAREIMINCPCVMLSKILGLKKGNIEYWDKLFPNLKITVQADESINEITIH